MTFHHRPQLPAEDLILPPGLLEKVRHQVIDLGLRREAMRRAGQHLKRGVLLYGPPGTGKTHTVRYLLSRSAGATAILLSAGSLALVAEAARMAQALQPAIVVLEDCDLVAEDRGFGPGSQPLLFELLEAMDGLDADADVAFVLTTNRVESLERALAQRPGRVDLAVEIPLPGQDERRALLELYAGPLGFSAEASEHAAAETAGNTASFTKELVRRAVLAAALEDREVGDADLEAAVDELMSAGSDLTRSLLGAGDADPDGARLRDFGGTSESLARGSSFGWFPSRAGSSGAPGFTDEEG
ncbi:AAA family ATPase [Arthrobacter sp. JSM 101049]|uniref:AAA family ATPase n=1 Tax=Arthrobacter sp. JSM 101049 TaxID=929097 RepID=UPI003568F437